MGHDHHHHHDHANGYPASRAFAIGVALNAAIVVLQVVYGLAANSMALLADAGHNLGDVLGLALAWMAVRLARSRPTKRHTYGMRRATILSALANAVLLLVATGGVGWEAIHRLRAPEAVQPMPVVIVASIAALANGVSALFFVSGRDRDLNARSALLHLAGDAATSLGVVVASLVIMRTGWTWLDPLAAIAVCALILAATWSLLKQSLALAMDAVPKGIDLDHVNDYLGALPDVVAVHDLHVWAMSTTDTALTAHLVMCTTPSATFLGDVSRTLHERFGIGHATLQVEQEKGADPCALSHADAI